MSVFCSLVGYHLVLVEELFELLHEEDDGLGGFRRFADQEVGPEFVDCHALVEVFRVDVRLEHVSHELGLFEKLVVELFVLGGFVAGGEPHEREEVLLVEVVEDDFPDFFRVCGQEHLGDVVAGLEDRDDELFLREARLPG